ncbi:MAG: hypothetical protein JWR22_2835 [Herminiimonas sp.]|nr:hypothetical protein [Herminiimonas sp.]
MDCVDKAQGWFLVGAAVVVVLAAAAYCIESVVIFVAALRRYRGRKKLQKSRE